MSVLFIADLHLSDNQPEIYNRFIQFINSKARDARALYILGDLFQYYLGDDVKLGVIQKVANEIDALVNKYKTKCYFIAGNRDFLLGEGFLPCLQILNESTCINLDDTSLIITHGDELCTDDVEYQKVRKKLRNPAWQSWFLSQNLTDRIKFAESARKKSQQHTQSMQSEIMDVNQQAVLSLFNKYNCTKLLHGHTHRPAFHQFEHAGNDYVRMVLGDWHYQISYIEYEDSNFKLVNC